MNWRAASSHVMQAVTAVAVLVLSACGDPAWGIGAINHCDVAVEATVADASEKTPPFYRIEPGASVLLRVVSEGKPFVSIGVRIPGAPAPALSKVRPASLTKGTKGANSDFYFEITECPPR